MPIYAAILIGVVVYLVLGFVFMVLVEEFHRSPGHGLTDHEIAGIFVAWPILLVISVVRWVWRMLHTAYDTVVDW